MPNDHELITNALERYHQRFLAVHGQYLVVNRGDIEADRLIYGDLVSPDVLNRWNAFYVDKYISLFLDSLPDSMQQFASNEIEFENEESVCLVDQITPIMAGMFEQVFLHGLMYAQAAAREGRNGA